MRVRCSGLVDGYGWCNCYHCYGVGDNCHRSMFIVVTGFDTIIGKFRLPSQAQKAEYLLTLVIGCSRSGSFDVSRRVWWSLLRCSAGCANYLDSHRYWFLVWSFPLLIYFVSVIFEVNITKAGSGLPVVSLHVDYCVGWLYEQNMKEVLNYRCI